MDAKYKPIQNIRGDDYHQILSYLLRFDSNEGIFVYPEVSDHVSSKVLKLKIGVDVFNSRSSIRDNPEIIIKKVAFHIPKDLSYISFVEKIRNHENQFSTLVSSWV